MSLTPNVILRVCTFAACCLPGLLFSQQRFKVEVARNCSYSGAIDELYQAENDPRVSALIARILKECDASQNFTIQATNVETVAAVVEDSNRYLLYNPDWFAERHDSNQIEVAALFAHEIAHHVKGHKLDGVFRAREETEADEFMGFALAKLGVLKTRTLELAQFPELEYPSVIVDDREKALIVGWGRADNLLKSKDKLNFLEQPDINAALPIPRFNFPPPECSAREVLDKNMFLGCASLADVDARLTSALTVKGYDQRAYYFVPNGFAVVTQLEQFDATTGISKSAAVRWVDYPVQENFEDFWEYCKSLVKPAIGYFRVMAFVVTDQPFTTNGQPIKKEVAAGWLNNGANTLPKEISALPWKDGYKVTLLAYEFETPASTKIAKKKCPCLKTGKQHLETSGLSLLLNKKAPTIPSKPKPKPKPKRN